MKPLPGSSEIFPLLAKAEPIRDGGSTSGITYSRRENVSVQDCNSAHPSSVKEEDRESPGEAAVPLQLLETHDGADIHLQPIQEANARAGMCSKETLTVKFLAGSMGPGRGAHSGAGFVTKAWMRFVCDLAGPS